MSLKSDVQTEDRVPAVPSLPQSQLSSQPEPALPVVDADEALADSVTAEGILQILSSGSHPLGMKATELVERSGATFTCNSIAGSAAIVANLPAALSGDAQNFTAGARGCIREGQSAFDTWNITDLKILSNETIAL